MYSSTFKPLGNDKGAAVPFDRIQYGLALEAIGHQRLVSRLESNASVASGDASLRSATAANPRLLQQRNVLRKSASGQVEKSISTYYRSWSSSIAMRGGATTSSSRSTAPASACAARPIAAVAATVTAAALAGVASPGGGFVVSLRETVGGAVEFEELSPQVLDALRMKADVQAKSEADALQKLHDS